MAALWWSLVRSGFRFSVFAISIPRLRTHAGAVASSRLVRRDVYSFCFSSATPTARGTPRIRAPGNVLFRGVEVFGFRFSPFGQKNILELLKDPDVGGILRIRAAFKARLVSSFFFPGPLKLLERLRSKSEL